MTGNGFVVAMRVVARIAAPAPAAGLAAQDWLIVARWGPGGAYLSISEAVEVARGHNGGPDDEAPPSLHPHATWFGRLAGATAAGGALFLLDQTTPDSMPLAGRFRAADGYARLQPGEQGRRRLLLLARALPGAAGATGLAPAWHLRAEQRPWLGTCIDDAG
jgi:hypothetical protein